jgi:hydroxymethylbilane synthase
VPKSNRDKLRVGTRDSKLARLQTDIVLLKLGESFKNLSFEIVYITTSGSKDLTKPISELGGRGVFVKELEDALLANEVDFVVHSLKDLTTDIPKGLVLAAAFNREDIRDVLISKNKIKFHDLPKGAKIATSSVRRMAQLKALRQDLEFVDIRGNVPTRLKKFADSNYDAMVLAAAGLIRLQLTEHISQYLEIEESCPAAGQGALAVECRQDDNHVLDIVCSLNESIIRIAVDAERAFLNEVGGGCSAPVGAYAKVDNMKIELTACIASLDGERCIKKKVTGPDNDPVGLGKSLANELLSAGAAQILSEINQNKSPVSPP